MDDTISIYGLERNTQKINKAWILNKKRSRGVVAKVFDYTAK